MALKDVPPSLPTENAAPTQPALAAPEGPFSELLRASSAARPLPPPATVVGRLLALTAGHSCALVTFDGQPTAAAVPARTTVDLFPDQIGHEVVLAFEAGDPARPIVMGVIRSPLAADGLKAANPSVDVQVDGQRLTIQATGELVLQCGRSRITLGADGRMTLSADVIVSHAAETNRIRGGSVQLN